VFLFILASDVQVPSGFTFSLEEGVLRVLTVLKNPSPRLGLKLRALCLMASTLTITPPRRLQIVTNSEIGKQLFALNKIITFRTCVLLRRAAEKSS
jgi:hypothetical protein